MRPIFGPQPDVAEDQVRALPHAAIAWSAEVGRADGERAITRCGLVLTCKRFRSSLTVEPQKRALAAVFLSQKQLHARILNDICHRGQTNQRSFLQLPRR